MPLTQCLECISAQSMVVALQLRFRRCKNFELVGAQEREGRWCPTMGEEYLQQLYRITGHLLSALK